MVKIKNFNLNPTKSVLKTFAFVKLLDSINSSLRTCKSEDLQCSECAFGDFPDTYKGLNYHTDQV